MQPVYGNLLLQRISDVNKGSLSKLTLSQDFLAEDSSVRVRKGAPILDLIEIGVRDQTASPTVLSALFTEIAAQTTYVTSAIPVGTFS